MTYYYGCKYKKEITDYSPFFESVEDSLKWYENYGKKLEKMFNRKLIAVVKK